ncbi:MAG: hypothetical protein WAW60_01030 [Candidatus Saccharimonadales bacterium]
MEFFMGAHFVATNVALDRGEVMIFFFGFVLLGTAIALTFGPYQGPETGIVVFMLLAGTCMTFALEFAVSRIVKAIEKGRMIEDLQRDIKRQRADLEAMSKDI